MRRNQQGIALITVLLVMSLALLVTAGMLRSHRLALHSRFTSYSFESWRLPGKPGRLSTSRRNCATRRPASRQDKSGPTLSLN